MDAERRAAGRRSEASGDVADRARLLQTRLRAGELIHEQVELMAYVGDPAAASVVEVGPLPEYPVSIGTGERPRPGGHWQLGSHGSRELGLWIDELGMRFGACAGVRAAWLALQHVVPRSKGKSNARTRLLDAVEGWLGDPGETRLQACEQARRGLRRRGVAHDITALGWLCGAVERATRSESAAAELAFALATAVEHLILDGLDRTAAEVALRDAVRLGLVPWAERAGEVVRDPSTLAARARLALRADPLAAVAQATRALTTASAQAGASARIDPALLVLRAETLRAAGDLEAALGDADGALGLDGRSTPARRMRGLVLADLARSGAADKQAGYLRQAVADLETYLDRVLVQVTSSGETKLVGPPEAEEAKAALARLKEPG